MGPLSLSARRGQLLLKALKVSFTKLLGFPGGFLSVSEPLGCLVVPLFEFVPCGDHPSPVLVQNGVVAHQLFFLGPSR